MTHCGRKKEMNDPYETNLPTHTHSYILYCVYIDVWVCVCLCGHWQSMHKLAIPVFALGRLNASACSLSDFFSLSRFYCAWYS
jgi:hypothetical protein